MFRVTNNKIDIRFVMQSTEKITKKIWPGVFRELVHGKIKQADIAAATEVTQSAVSQYLAGTRSPGAWELYRIAQFLGVSMEYLLTGVEQGKTTVSSPQQPRPDKQNALAVIRDMRQSLVSLENVIKKI